MHCSGPLFKMLSIVLFLHGCGSLNPRGCWESLCNPVAPSDQKQRVNIFQRSTSDPPSLPPRPPLPFSASQVFSSGSLLMDLTKERPLHVKQLSVIGAQQSVNVKGKWATETQRNYPRGYMSLFRASFVIRFSSLERYNVFSQEAQWETRGKRNDLLGQLEAPPPRRADRGSAG